MALFKALRGNRSSLDAQSLHDGYAYFCADDGSFWIDYTDADGNLQRKQINEADLEALGYKIDSLPQADYNQNDETAKDYILNRTHWAGDPVTNTWVALEETTFETYDGGGGEIFGTSFNLVDSAECVVTWDGIEYTTICKTEVVYGIEVLCLGNYILMGLENAEDNGQPFCIAYSPMYAGAMVATLDAEPASHTVQIMSSTTTQEIHKLDNKYIDAEWMAKPPIGDRRIEFFPEGTLSTENDIGGLWAYMASPIDGFVANGYSKAYVTVDGVEYVSDVMGEVYQTDNGAGNIVLGNLSGIMTGSFGTGDPYAVQIAAEYLLLVVPSNGSHTLKIEFAVPVYEQLPTHYIENDLAKVDANKYFNNSGTLVWDGNTDGRDNIEGVAWKVSDDTPTAEDLYKGFTIGITSNAESGVLVVSAEEALDIVQDQGLLVAVGEFVWILSSPLEGFSAGTYLFGMEEEDGFTYVSSFSINGYKFNDGSEKIIKTEHLPEALRFGETPSDTLSWTAVPEDKLQEIIDPSLLVAGMFYPVSTSPITIDDLAQGSALSVPSIEINATLPKEAWTSSTSDICVLDDVFFAVAKDGASYVNSDGTEFVFPKAGFYMPAAWLMYDFTFTINGYSGFGKIQKIDPKYLPEGIGGGGSGLPTVTTADNGKSVSVVNGVWEVKKLSYNDLSDKPTLGALASKNALTASDVGADASGTASSLVSQHKADTTAHITSTERTNWNAAKTHADSAHAPSNAEKNQNAFSNVQVGSTTIAADTTTDTLTIAAGSNITITPDATNDKITIAATDTTYSEATTTQAGLMSAADKIKLDGLSESGDSVEGVVTEEMLFETIPGGDTVTWDGSFDGLESTGGLSLGISQNLYKVSDITAEAFEAIGNMEYSTETLQLTYAMTYDDPDMDDYTTQIDLLSGFMLGEGAKVTNNGSYIEIYINSWGNMYDGYIIINRDGIWYSDNTSGSTGGLGMGAGRYCISKLSFAGVSLTEDKKVIKSDLLQIDISEINTVTDTEMSNTSENPVQNKVIKAYVDSKVYTHPSYTAKSTGLYKVTVDGLGHISGTVAVSKSDITALGIPAQDTTYNAAGSSLGLVKTGGDVSINDGVITVNDDSHEHTINTIVGLQDKLTELESSTGGASSWSDLQDKPVIISGTPDTITFDGNIAGKPTAEVIPGYIYFVKVSEVVLHIEDCSAGGHLQMVAGEESQVATWSATDVSMNHEVLMINGTMVASGLAGALVGDGSWTLPEDGTYLCFSNSAYLSSFTINGFTGFAKEVLKENILPDTVPVIQTASVGDVVVVSNVDENGKPISWKTQPIGGSGLPAVTTSDNGKSVSVVNGAWEVKKLSHNDLSDIPSVDTVMSSTSTNAVQNNVIKSYVDNAIEAAIGAAISASY